MTFRRISGGFPRRAYRPYGQAPSVSTLGTGAVHAVARPDGVRPPSGCPGGAIVYAAKAVLIRDPDIRGYPEGRRHTWTRVRFDVARPDGVRTQWAVPEGYLYIRDFENLKNGKI